MSAAIDTRSILSDGADIKNETDWYPDVEDNEYHADKTTVGSSSLKMILRGVGSPAAFYDHFFLGSPTEDTDCKRLGRLIHKAVLEGGVFLKNYAIEPEFIGKTKDGKESKQSAEAKALKKEWYASLAPGTIVTTQYEITTITKIVNSILTHTDGKFLFKNGQAEVAGMFVDPETLIRCRFKPDFLSFDSSVLVDLKSAKSTEKFAFGRQAAQLRYDFQLYMYAFGVKMITGRMPEVILNCGVEKTGVCEPALYYYTPSHLLRAESDFRNALRDLRKAIDTNNWHFRQQKLEPIHFPEWFVTDTVRMEEEDERRSEQRDLEPDLGPDLGFDVG